MPRVPLLCDSRSSTALWTQSDAGLTDHSDRKGVSTMPSSLPTAESPPSPRVGSSRRANLISVRLNDEEFAVVAANAAADHRTLATFGRLAMLDACEQDEG
jgi:hypothetical protein